jgi:hypothetical protein
MLPPWAQAGGFNVSTATPDRVPPGREDGGNDEGTRIARAPRGSVCQPIRPMILEDYTRDWV